MSKKSYNISCLLINCFSGMEYDNKNQTNKYRYKFTFILNLFYSQPIKCNCYIKMGSSCTFI